MYVLNVKSWNVLLHKWQVDERTMWPQQSTYHNSMNKWKTLQPFPGQKSSLKDLKTIEFFLNRPIFFGKTENLEKILHLLRVAHLKVQNCEHYITTNLGYDFVYNPTNEIDPSLGTTNSIFAFLWRIRRLCSHWHSQSSATLVISRRPSKSTWLEFCRNKKGLGKVLLADWPA